MAWESRIVGHGEAAPTDLVGNPRNWRTHPKAQRDALAGVLDQVGWVQDVIVNRRTGYLVDGHARVAVAAQRGETSVPVVYVDLSEDEEMLILATLDPLAAMADSDAAKLDELLRNVDTGSEALQQMIASTAAQAGLYGTLRESDGPSDIEATEAEESAADRDYGASAIRQIVLVFEQAQYEPVVEALGEHAEKFGLSNNTEVILHLLETNGYAVSRRDPA